MDHMTSNGLRFAPAVEGDKPFYSSFYNLLTGYDAGVSQLIGK
jgi:precorrin-2 methylase